MKNGVRYLFVLVIILCVFASFRKADNPLSGHHLSGDTVLYPDEKHFRNIQQLTFGGDNAEAYLSYDDQYLIFQRTNPKEGLVCDQMFIGKLPATVGIHLNIR